MASDPTGKTLFITVSVGGSKGVGGVPLAYVNGKGVLSGQVKEFPLTKDKPLRIERPGVANTVRVTNTSGRPVRMNGDTVPDGKSRVVEPRSHIVVRMEG